VTKSAELKELEGIKRLLITLLLKLGASSEEIGLALGVDSSAVRKLFSMKGIKKIQLIR
jgi:hypothetical protein